MKYDFVGKIEATSIFIYEVVLVERVTLGNQKAGVFFWLYHNVN